MSKKKKLDQSEEDMSLTSEMIPEQEPQAIDDWKSDPSNQEVAPIKTEPQVSQGSRSDKMETHSKFSKFRKSQ